MVRCIKDIVKRHFEYVSHFEFVGRQTKAYRYQSDDGCDEKTGTGFVRVKIADDLHETRLKTDFFFSLAQGGCSRALVFRFDAPTWKADLASVVMKVLGPLRQQDGAAPGPIYDRNQCRRRD